MLSKRTALLEDLNAALDTQMGANVAKAERILAALEKTYSEPARDVPRLALYHPYLLLIRIYHSQNQHNKVISTAWKLLTSLGFTIKRPDPPSLSSPFEIEQWGLMEDCLIDMWVHLWTAYAQVAPDLCGKAEEYARITYRICVGEDDTFDKMYGERGSKSCSRV